tara:strand:+ start:381 stop:524 length:144 start_codon:yes stop_codon:yes gene_type:complete
MNYKYAATSNENHDFSVNSEDSDYKNLITRLKEISKTIVLLENTILK